MMTPSLCGPDVLTAQRCVTNTRAIQHDIPDLRDAHHDPRASPGFPDPRDRHCNIADFTDAQNFIPDADVFMAGFRDCAQEAIKYLIEVENVPEDDILIRELKSQLSTRQCAIAEYSDAECDYSYYSNSRTKPEAVSPTDDVSGHYEVASAPDAEDEDTIARRSRVEDAATELCNELTAHACYVNHELQAHALYCMSVATLDELIGALTGDDVTDLAMDWIGG